MFSNYFSPISWKKSSTRLAYILTLQMYNSTSVPYLIVFMRWEGMNNSKM